MEWDDILGTAIWAAVILVLGILLIRGRNRAAELQLQIDKQTKEAKLLGSAANAIDHELEQRERRLRLRIAEGVADETIALQKADLLREIARAEKETAEMAAAQVLLGDMAEERATAERRILDARTVAEEAQAGEHVRAEHELVRRIRAEAATKAQDTGVIVDLFAKYLKICKDYNQSAANIATFAKTLRNS